MPRSKPPRRDRSQGDDSHDREGEAAAGAERLQKVLAAAGIGSRRDCEELIREGRVEVDRQVVTELGTKVDPLQHEIRVDGQPIRKPKRMYFLVNKPMGVVTTNFDPSGRTRVIDLVPTEERVFPVGRLDRYSEGLILVTNDGEFANRLTHPRYGVEKTYLVRVAGEPDQTKVAKLKRGIHLSDGFCQVESIKIKGKRGNSTDMIMVLNEGRNREIRRILARVGHKVLRLKRIAVGPLKLADLPTGAWRKLLPREVELLLEDSHKQEQKAKTAKPKRDQRRAQREAAGVDDELDETLLRPGSSLADDHVAEDEELLGAEELAGLGGELEGDDESLLADGDFGEDDADEFLAAMGLGDDESNEEDSDEDLADEEDEDFEIVDISEDEFERPGRGRQPLGDVLAFDDDEADFDELEDDEAAGPPTAPRRPRRGPQRGGPQRGGPPRGAAGPRGRRGAAGPRGRRGAGEGRGSRAPRGEGAGRGGVGRGGPRRTGAGRAEAERGDFASRRPGTRRKVKGEGGGSTYRGGFGSRPGREEGGTAGESRGRRPGAKRPPGRSGGAAGGGGRARFGEGGGPRGERPSRGPGGRPGGRASGKRSGPGGRPQGGPGGGRPSGGRPGGSGGSRPGGGRPGGRGPSGGGPRGRGPGPGGPRKGGPRKGGPRR